MLARIVPVALSLALTLPAAAQTPPGGAPALSDVSLDTTQVVAGTPVRVSGTLATQQQPPERLWVDATLAGDLGSFQYPFDPILDLVEGWVEHGRPGDPLSIRIKVAPAIGADSGPKPFQWFRWAFHLGDRWYFVEFNHDQPATPGVWRGSWYYCNLALGSNCIHGTTPPFPVTFDAATRTFTGRIPIPDLAAVQPGGTLVQDSMRPFSTQYPPESGYDFGALLNRHDASAPFASYELPIESVLLGIAPAGTAPQSVAYGTRATVQPSAGSLEVPFSAAVPTAGLAPGEYDVWVKGCFGPCVARPHRITVT